MISSNQHISEKAEANSRFQTAPKSSSQNMSGVTVTPLESPSTEYSSPIDAPEEILHHEKKPKDKSYTFGQIVQTMIYLGDSRDGRDKVYRIIQYFSKFCAWVSKSLQSDPTWFLQLSSSFSAGRKLFRLFRSVDFIYKALNVIKFNPKLIQTKFFQFFKFIFVALWLFFDSLTWLAQNSIISKKYAKMFNKPRFYSWLTFLIIDLVRLLVNKSIKVKPLAKTCVDIILPLGYLKLLPINDGIIGICGTITSVLGMLSLLP